MLYKLEILESNIGANGLAAYMNRGTAITVEGSPMVRLGHGAIVPATGYFGTEAEAKLAAARKVELIRDVLDDQARRLRSEAATESASGGRSGEVVQAASAGERGEP